MSYDPYKIFGLILAKIYGKTKKRSATVIKSKSFSYSEVHYLLTFSLEYPGILDEARVMIGSPMMVKNRIQYFYINEDLTTKILEMIRRRKVEYEVEFENCIKNLIQTYLSCYERMPDGSLHLFVPGKNPIFTERDLIIDGVSWHVKFDTKIGMGLRFVVNLTS